MAHWILDSILQDVRYGARLQRRSPRFRVLRPFLLLTIAGGSINAQSAPAHAACRDPHPASACGGYFLFEYNSGLRLGGTNVSTTFESRDALRSWFGWDIGWMKNIGPSTSLGAALELGGSADGTRIAVRAKRRSWLSHKVVFDVSGGPLMSMLQRGGAEGVTPTYGATADVGFGRARLGLVTLGADVARQRSKVQFATHAGVRAESRGAVIVTAVAIAGTLALLSAIGRAGY